MLTVSVVKNTVVKLSVTAVPNKVVNAAAAAAGDSWTLKGENTLITSDGLFAIYFPETLEATIGGKVVTVGAIKTEAPA